MLVARGRLGAPRALNRHLAHARADAHVEAPPGSDAALADAAAGALFAADCLAYGSPGELCGELSFFTGEPRALTLVALAPTAVWELERAALDRLAAARPDVAFALQTLALRYASQRLHHLQLLGHVPSV